MRALDVLHTFESFMHHAGKEINNLSSREAVELMLDFYAKIRAEDCNFQKNGDMLLFQWGTYDWGDGEHFEYNVTRQLIPSRGETQVNDQDDQSIWQLALTLKYLPAPELSGVQSGSKWCESPSQLGEFARFISNCEATQRVNFRRAQAVELTFEDAE